MSDACACLGESGGEGGGGGGGNETKVWATAGVWAFEQEVTPCVRTSSPQTPTSEVNHIEFSSRRFGHGNQFVCYGLTTEQSQKSQKPGESTCRRAVAPRSCFLRCPHCSLNSSRVDDVRLRLLRVGRFEGTRRSSRCGLRGSGAGCFYVDLVHVYVCISVEKLGREPKKGKKKTKKKKKIIHFRRGQGLGVPKQQTDQARFNNVAPPPLHKQWWQRVQHHICCFER